MANRNASPAHSEYGESEGISPWQRQMESVEDQFKAFSGFRDKTDSPLQALAALIHKIDSKLDAKFDAIDAHLFTTRGPTTDIPGTSRNPTQHRDKSPASPTPIQVPTQNLESNRRNSSLGYRSGLNVENRDSMLKKIELSMFTGRHPCIWLLEAERFFQIGHYSDKEKLEVVALWLEGNVKKWFYWEQRHNGFGDWSNFKKKLVLKFSEASETLDIANGEMHSFDGTHPSVWLENFERFFPTFNDKDKLDAVFLYLEGKARKWYYWEKWHKGFKDWSEFKRRLVLTFSAASANSGIANPEMPSFDGTDPYVWLEKSERFFHIGQYNNEAKLSLIFLYLEGEARKWFCRRRFLDWTEFKCRLMKKFGPAENDSPSEVEQQNDPNSSGGAVQEMILKKESTPVLVQATDATDLRNELDSTTSLEMTTSEVKLTEESNSTRGAAHEVLLENESTRGSESSILEDTAEVSRTCRISNLVASKEENSVTSMHIAVIEVEETLKISLSCGFNNLVSHMGSNPTNYVVVNEISAEESVKMPPNWTDRAKPHCEHQLFDHRSQRETRKRKQSKFLKAWKFKFKHRAESKDLQSGFANVSKIKSTYSHLWHRWKYKIGLLQTVSKSMPSKEVPLRFRIGHGFSGFVRGYKEDLELFLVIVESQGFLNMTRLIPAMKCEMITWIQDVLEQMLPHTPFHLKYGLDLFVLRHYKAGSAMGFDMKTTPQEQIYFSVWLCWRKKELQPLGNGIILICSSLGSSFISTEGVYKSISTCLIMVDVQLWLLSTGSEFEVLKRNDRNQGKKKSLFTHLLHILIQQEKKWKRLYKSRMFKYKGGRLDTKLVRQSQKSRDRAPLAFKWEGVLDSVSAAIDRSWK